VLLWDPSLDIVDEKRRGEFCWVVPPSPELIAKDEVPLGGKRMTSEESKMSELKK